MSHLPSLQPLQGRRLVLALSGGVACYKSAELLRLLVKAGAEVRVMMSEAAQAFITVATMQALSGHRVATSQWDPAEANHMPHINWGREADAIVLAPASADMIARLVQGRADELVSLTCLARPRERCALLVAPAMNREMWSHPATQRNVAQLQADGAVVMGPGHGDQACGEFGDGRMLEPEELLAEIVAALSPKPMAGRRVLITAGPTYEALDPVRGITNRSSGKMGYALARAAFEAGAEVTLVSGPVALKAPRGVSVRRVESAREMLSAVQAAWPGQDVFIATAAVADWRPAQEAGQKIKKDGSGEVPALAFVENPDILATMAARADGTFCVGFAAESEHLVAHAQAKRLRKGVPLLVGNLGPATFGRDDNALVLVDEAGVSELPEGALQGVRADKQQLAGALVLEIAARLAARQA